jgi:hypothetical protein
MTAMTDSSRGFMAGPGAPLRSATHHETAEKQPPVPHGTDLLAHTAPDAAPVCTRISIRLMNGTTREEAWAIAGALRACFDGACHLKASMDKVR